MPVRCGIDLGTTYSAISWYDAFNHRVETVDLDSADGRKILRSAVYFPGADEDPVVGDTAWNAAQQHPDRVITGIKRSMGTSFKTAPIDGREYSPQEVSAEILKVLTRDGGLFLGEEIHDVVITVPAYFGDNQRSATEEAGKLAGLNVLALLPEPHAAALAYAVENAVDLQERYLLVYDLGGGTFDVTLIHAKKVDDGQAGIGLDIRTLCKAGNRELGGLDWDHSLAELVAERVLQEHSLDVREDPDNEPLLLDNCEKAKRHLSRTNQAAVVADAQNHQVDVAVTDFEGQTSDLLLQTQALLEQVLEEAERDHGVSKDQIEVMLTGGSSRMPMVHQMLENVMGRPPFQYRNPELLVTIGAAYWAHLLGRGDEAPGDQPAVATRAVGEDGVVASRDVRVQLTDIGFAVGVEVQRPDGQGSFTSVNTVVVSDGAVYGQQFKKEFATVFDGQTEIQIALYEGDSENPDECTPLKTFTITGLPEGRPKGQRVLVEMGYDDSGILRGVARDQQTGQEVEILIDRK